MRAEGSDVPQGPDWRKGSDGRFYPPQQGAPGPPEKKGMHGCLKALLIGGVVALVLGVGCVAVVDQAADDVNEENEEREASIQDDAELVACETNAAGWMSARVRITNDSSERSNYSVDVSFVSPDGSEQYDSGAAIASSLAAGQTTTQEASSTTEPPGAFECEIVDVVRFTDE